MVVEPDAFAAHQMERLLVEEPVGGAEQGLATLDKGALVLGQAGGRRGRRSR